MSIGLHTAMVSQSKIDLIKKLAHLSRLTAFEEATRISTIKKWMDFLDDSRSLPFCASLEPLISPAYEKDYLQAKHWREDKAETPNPPFKTEYHIAPRVVLE